MESLKAGAIYLKFRADTPARILIEVRKRYAAYLVDCDEIEDWHTLDMHKKIEASLTPGDWLCHLREANGFTQEALGLRLGKVSGNRIADWEGNRRAVSKTMAKKLSIIFGVSPRRFI